MSQEIDLLKEYNENIYEPRSYSSMSLKCSNFQLGINSQGKLKFPTNR